MEQGDTPESHSTAFHYRRVMRGLQRMLLGAPAWPVCGQQATGGGATAVCWQACFAQQAHARAGGGGNRGERRQAGAEIQLPPALVKARGRVQAVQAAGPLPSVVGMQTTGTPQHAGDQSGWEGVALDAAVAFVFSCAWSDEQRAANAPC